MCFQALLLRQISSKKFLILEFWSLLRILQFFVPWPLHGHIIFRKVFSLLLGVKFAFSHMLFLWWIHKHTSFYVSLDMHCKTLEGKACTITSDSGCTINKHRLLCTHVKVSAYPPLIVFLTLIVIILLFRWVFSSIALVHVCFWKCLFHVWNYRFCLCSL